MQIATRLMTYLDTWSGFEAAKTAPWPSRRLHHLSNSLSRQMSELVVDAVASCCDDMVGKFWLIRNELQKFVEIKFEFFSLNTFDVSQIFWQRVVQLRPKYSYCIFSKGLWRVSVCWILNNAVHVLDVFWFLLCVPLYHQYLTPYAVLSSKYIYNYIPFTASLERL